MFLYFAKTICFVNYIQSYTSCQEVNIFAIWITGCIYNEWLTIGVRLIYDSMSGVRLIYDSMSGVRLIYDSMSGVRLIYDSMSGVKLLYDSMSDVRLIYDSVCQM